MNTYLVTATPPTPNGDLHVGHLSGPFLAADVFNRHQRMLGHRSLYLTSSDDHQSYVMTTAERQERDPAELASSCTDGIKATLEAAEIQVDCFTSALGNEAHIGFVQGFFRLLHQRGIVVAKDHEILHCGACSQFLFESFAHGGCPYCGEEASGNLCEACGRVNDPLDLIDPSCGLCGGKPTTVEYRGLFLPLEQHRAQLEAFYASRTSWRPHLRALCDALLAEPLRDYPVSYPTSWGIPVPVDGFEGQAINVWLEMYPGQIQTARTWCEREGDAETAERLRSGQITLVQFLGYDNSFFNAVLHTTVALALGEAWPVPEHIVTNEFYFLEGEKFSTSRDHAIWGRDILAEVDADSLRYHLCRTNPEHWQTNFSSPDLLSTQREELGGTWNEAIGALFQLAGEEPAERTQAPDLQAQGLIGWAAAGLERFYGVEEFSLRHASSVLHDYVEAAGEYANRRAEQQGPPAEATSPALGSALLLKALALFSAPLMPAFAQQLWDGLGLDGSVASQPWEELEAPFRGNVRIGGESQWFSPAAAAPLLSGG